MPKTMTRPDPSPRRTIDEVIGRALYAAAVATMDALHRDSTDADTRAAVRDELAADIEHITANPRERLRFGWAWDDGAHRERERARSLGIVVHVLHPDGTDRAELGRWRVRELCMGDGTPVDTVETLRHLAAQLRMGPVPDDVRELVQAPDEVRDEYTDGVRLVLCALTTLVRDPHAPVGTWACCAGRGDRELSDIHRHAHAVALNVEPERRAEGRAAYLATLHRLTGRAA